jgi:hypothetical protein
MSGSYTNNADGEHYDFKLSGDGKVKKIVYEITDATDLGNFPIKVNYQDYTIAAATVVSDFLTEIYSSSNYKNLTVKQKFYEEGF